MSDLISRQDIKYHVQLEAMGNGQYEEVEIAYRSDIESLPSADRPTGEWIKEIAGNGWNEWVNLTCNQCGAKFEDAGRWTYCPKCGAEMSGR